MRAVEERTEQIAHVHARLGAMAAARIEPAKKPKRSKKSPSRGKSGHPKHEVRRRKAKEEDDVVTRARRGKKGAKFAALFDDGNWQGQGYPSQSEADLALCTRLAARCGGDAAQVDALFRQSALMRPKWDEPHFADGRTYGEETVRKAVHGHDHRIVVPPSVGDGSAEEPAGDGRTFMCTDTGNAERLVHQFGEQLRFIHAWKKFLFWDKRRWKEDDRGMPMRYSKDVVRSIYREAANCADSAKREDLVDWAVASEKVDRRRALVELAKSEPAVVVVPDQLDQNPWLLNCANGTLDLRTGELRPHARDDHITKLCPVEYDPSATAPTWLMFLARVLPLIDVREFVQRVVGWSITGDVSEQVLLFLYGTGANGKSVFLSTLLRMLGIDYAIQAAPDLVLSRRFATHPTDIADLFGKRLVATVEVGAGQSFDEVLVKQLTGGDRIRARRMREDFWEFDPTHHLWIAGNHKPVVRGTDYAIWRRILLVPFTVTIPKAERDKKLLERLAAELPGILKWGVEGCRSWQANGLNPPEAVLLATEEYRSEMDLVGRFLAERCVRRPGAKTRATELFHACMRWCVAVDEQPRSQTFFGEAMTELGVQKCKTAGWIWYQDVALAGSPGGAGEGWGESGPDPDINAFRAPRAEVNPERGPDCPQPSPRQEAGQSVPRDDALHADTCRACGSTRWWRRRESALRVCVTCHPPSGDADVVYVDENTPVEPFDPATGNENQEP